MHNDDYDQENTIAIKYCLPQTINQKRQKNLVFQATFAQKMGHLKCKGRKLATQEKIEEWIHNLKVDKQSK